MEEKSLIPIGREECEPPREKLERLGSSALTDKELVKLILSTGNSRRTLDEISTELLSKLDRSRAITVSEIMEISGIGIAKAAAVIASLELGRRRGLNKRRTISSPQDTYREIVHYASREQEHFIVVLVNGAHEVIETFVSTIGTLTESLVHPREVFAPAIEKRAAAILIAHNHPSGMLIPSNADKEVTRRLVRSGEILGISVLDHLIFTDEGYYSFLEHSLIFKH